MNTIIKINNKQRVIVQELDGVSCEQLNMFSGNFKEEWFDGLIQTANKFRYGFWFSELRTIYNIAPAHPNWWGCASKKLKKAGFKPSGETRSSPIKSRNGGTDRKWQGPNQFYNSYLNLPKMN